MAKAPAAKKTTAAPKDEPGTDVTVQQPKSAAAQQKSDMERFLDALTQRRGDFEIFLAAHNIQFDFFLAVVKRALIKTPKLILCKPASLMQACLNCAADGLMPDGREAAINPFKAWKESQAAGTDIYEATYIPMFQGLLKIAYKATDGQGHMLFRDIEVDVIYEKEQEYFEYRRGDEGFIRFSPPLDRDINDKIVGAYCIVRTTTGGVFREVIGGQELKKISAVNKAQNGPNKDWPGEMAKKAPIRRIWKKLPRNAAMDGVFLRDEDSYLPTAVEKGAATTSIPNDKLFEDTAHNTAAPAQAAIEQGHDETIEIELPIQTARQLLVECSDAHEIEQTLAYMKGAPEYGELTEEEWAGLTENANILKERFGPATDKSPEQEAIERNSGSGGTGTMVVEGDVIDGATGEVLQEAGAPAAEEEDEEEIVHPGHAEPGEEYLMEGDEVGDDDRTQTYKDGKPFTRKKNWDGLKVYAYHSPELVEGAPGTKATTEDGPAAEAAPQIRSSPEDRVEPDDDDDPFNRPIGQIASTSTPKTTAAPAREPEPEAGATVAAEPEHDAEVAGTDYGAPEDELSPSRPTVLRARFAKTGDPKEYSLADATLWRDDILNKMSAFKESALPFWWADNIEFIEEAIPLARLQAGRILMVAVTKRLARASELIRQHGPFD